MAFGNSWLLIPILVLLKYLINSTQLAKAINWSETRWVSKAKQLSDPQVVRLSTLTDLDYRQFNETLDQLLVPRVVGSDGHSAVRQYISDFMTGLDWSLDYDAFNDKTPYGEKRFTNIVATLDPKACKRLVLSCHYDSKLTPSGSFQGATDSAVPCTMILQLAKSMDKYLKEHKNSALSDTTLQLIFFDGEEAFVQWSAQDSLYGSRHLARSWNRQKFLTTDDEKGKCGHLADLDSEIDRIEVMVLLDLLGAPNPVFYSHFSDTQSLHSQLVTIEQKLNALKRMESGRQSRTEYFKNAKSWFGAIEDDHIPFLNKGVPIVHVIPTPFPEVWHKETDNRQHIHFPTVNNLFKVFKVFVAQYLHLNSDQ